MANGRPVLASLAPDAAAASLLRESDAAVIVARERPPTLAREMRRLHEDAELRKRLGRNARGYAKGRSIAVGLLTGSSRSSSVANTRFGSLSSLHPNIVATHWSRRAHLREDECPISKL